MSDNLLAKFLCYFYVGTHFCKHHDAIKYVCKKIRERGLWCGGCYSCEVLLPFHCSLKCLVFLHRLLPCEVSRRFMTWLLFFEWTFCWDVVIRYCFNCAKKWMESYQQRKSRIKISWVNPIKYVWSTKIVLQLLRY